MLKKLLMYTDFEEVYEEIEDRYKAYLMMEYNTAVSYTHLTLPTN
jgi:hypothetical protein